MEKRKRGKVSEPKRKRAIEEEIPRGRDRKRKREREREREKERERDRERINHVKVCEGDFQAKPYLNYYSSLLRFALTCLHLVPTFLLKYPTSDVSSFLTVFVLHLT